MSNPVEPNPYGAPAEQPGTAFPPPNAGAPGAYPPPNPGAPAAYPPPNAGAPGAYPPPNAGAPGESAYPPPGAAAFPAPQPAPKKSFGKKLLGVLGTIVVLIVIAAVKFGIGFGVSKALSGDPTKDAKVGNCISVDDKLSDKETETKADIVDCSKSDAKFIVVGRVDGVNDVNSTACDKYFTEKDKDPAILSSPSDSKNKYLLCVKANG
ncbi:Annexin A11 [Actinoplanes sp. SE50]|uniref:LppU/SCO3897 family protein n=1 Tax=unclassified Actinoplanes TaxID=2626549 RepID=UPI00023EC035|nr:MULTISPECIES: hypothetical protein [unclassified Actinoplanes]AEV81835.1 Annexin A11 [Actinoplanes sp. SE50/110]ATO80236.1 Annexin A11 [Actinoplanes sp. SE50]SLL97641.1 hypothetical protein ACSP50_0848 [Actinoplanes sp. SE50/110]